jgi:hypothetical protein
MSSGYVRVPSEEWAKIGELMEVINRRDVFLSFGVLPDHPPELYRPDVVVPHAAKLAPPDRGAYGKDYKSYVEDYRFYLRTLAGFKVAFKEKVESEKERVLERNATVRKQNVVKNKSGKSEQQKAAKRARNRRQRKRKALAEIERDVKLATAVKAVSIANQGIRQAHTFVQGEPEVYDGWKVVVRRKGRARASPKGEVKGSSSAPDPYEKILKV